MLNPLPEWSNAWCPIYDIEKTYLENAEEGPFFSGPFPKRVMPPKGEWVDFLGYKVATRLGIPAGPLLNSRWVDFAGKMGFDIVTYKTIRSQPHEGHPLPNVILIDTPPNGSTKAYSLKNSLRNLEQLTITNSFGMPSRSPEYLLNDIARAKKALSPGQILVVSVVGTPSKDGSEKSFFNDFVKTALLAKEAGAEIIEANLSCPNVAKEEGCLYLSADKVFELSSNLVKAINGAPLILKVGLFPTDNAMKNAFVAAAKAGVRAISGINTINMEVLDETDRPALGASRKTSGVCGAAIREAALGFLRNAKSIIDEEKLDITLIGVGGITDASHFDLFREAGADFVQTATGMMWDPYIALRYTKGDLCLSKRLP